MYRFLQCTAAQYMTRDVTTVTRDVTLRDLEALFEKHDFNSFPVVEEGKMLGIVTKFDFLRAFAFTTGQMVPHYDELMKRPVAEVMTEAVVHVEPTAPLTRVLQLMVSLKARSFPVVGAERQLVGMISREDVMRALQRGDTGSAISPDAAGRVEQSMGPRRRAAERADRHDAAARAFLTGRRSDCSTACPRDAVDCDDGTRMLSLATGLM